MAGGLKKINVTDKKFICMHEMASQPSITQQIFHIIYTLNDTGTCILGEMNFLVDKLKEVVSIYAKHQCSCR